MREWNMERRRRGNREVLRGGCYELRCRVARARGCFAIGVIKVSSDAEDRRGVLPAPSKDDADKGDYRWSSTCMEGWHERSRDALVRLGGGGVDANGSVGLLHQ
eukprot:750129-Hanusia_phi.AAC.3